MSLGKSKWGNYIGAPIIVDKGFTSSGEITFGALSRQDIGGIHKLHYIHDYGTPDSTSNYSSSLQGQVVFTAQNSTLDTDFTYTVPASVTQMSAVVIAGGGGGGGNNGFSGPGAKGGGGGGLAYGDFSVTPGDTLTLRIGAGGTA